MSFTNINDNKGRFGILNGVGPDTISDILQKSVDSLLYNPKITSKKSGKDIKEKLVKIKAKLESEVQDLHSKALVKASQITDLPTEDCKEIYSYLFNDFTIDCSLKCFKDIEGPGCSSSSDIKEVNEDKRLYNCCVYEVLGKKKSIMMINSMLELFEDNKLYELSGSDFISLGF